MSGTLIVRGSEAISAVSEFENSCERIGLFRTSEWLKLWNASDFEACALLLADGGATVGLFPFCVRRRFGQTACYSMPDGMYGGAVSVDTRGVHELETAFIRFAADGGFSRVNVVEFSDEMNAAYSTFRQNRLVTHVLDLRVGIDRIERNLPDGHRGSISKAERSKLEIREVDSEQDIDDYWRLLRSTAIRRGRRTRHPREFYSRLRVSFPRASLRWQLAIWNGQSCAGHVCVCAGKSAFHWDACSDEIGRSLSANHFLLWRNIVSFAGEGYESLNLGASPKGATDLARFKARWGAKETEYFEYDRRTTLNKALGAIGSLVRR
jgi:hypothetical protein